jgi:hypothetical protein
MLEVWHSLPSEFRLPDPEATVTVWRGDKLGKLATGMACRLDTGDPQQVVLETARQGYEALLHLIDRHTSAFSNSPLVSVAGDIRLAQFFAGFRDIDETIYEINVPAHRLLRDPENIGTPRWPKDSELFVIGTVQPEEIVKLKTNNHESAASELVFEQNGRGYIANHFTDIRNVPVATLPNPLGTWENVASVVV